MDFEVFKERGTRRRESQPVVTFLKKGVMSLNLAAVEALKSPEAVELLYAPKARTVGLRAADKSLDHAYALRRPTRGLAKIVTAAAFFKHYGIDVTESRRYAGRMVGDVLAVDLSEALSADADQPDAGARSHP